MAVSFKDVMDAFEFVNFGAPYEHHAYLDKVTGKTYYQSDLGDEIDELPEDLDSEKYVGLPHKNDLDLGESLVFDFANQNLPNEVDRVQAIFSRRGAYANFKDLLDEKGMLDQWYEFESAASEKALREWCLALAIQVEG